MENNKQELWIIRNYGKLKENFLTLKKDQFKRFCEGSFESEQILGELRIKQNG